MRTLKNIYENYLGASYKILDTSEINEEYVALEINQISFLINDRELKSFISSTESIINYHRNCSCPPDLENKMVIYKAKQTEIRMLLSYNQLHQLKNLLKGTHFRLSMEEILKKYKIS